MNFYNTMRQVAAGAMLAMTVAGCLSSEQDSVSGGAGKYACTKILMNDDRLITIAKYDNTHARLDRFSSTRNELSFFNMTIDEAVDAIKQCEDTLPELPMKKGD